MATTKTRKSIVKKEAIDRPFAADVLRQARDIASGYQVVVRFDQEEGEYYGRGLELPNVMGDGKTPGACVASTRAALIAMTAFMLERGQRVPPPAANGQRGEQVNVRLTADEKLRLEGAARRKGYKSLSDFVRAAAMEKTTA
jgi:predicted RNase H-like HicB family nuclease